MKRPIDINKFKLQLRNNFQGVNDFDDEEIEKSFVLYKQALMECYRISSDYICHVENKHGDIIMSNQNNPKNKLNIDIRKFYEAIEVETVVYEEKPYVNASDHAAIYYVGKKR